MKIPLENEWKEPGTSSKEETHMTSKHTHRAHSHHQRRSEENHYVPFFIYQMGQCLRKWQLSALARMGRNMSSFTRWECGGTEPCRRYCGISTTSQNDSPLCPSATIYLQEIIRTIHTLMCLHAAWVHKSGKLEELECPSNKRIIK